MEKTYIVTGISGRLGGKVAENMLREVPGKQLIFTCSNLAGLNPEKRERWETQGVSVRQANYNDLEEMTEAFRGGDSIYIVSGTLNGPERVVQHKHAFDAAVAAGVKHIIYTSGIGADQLDVKQYVLPDHIASEVYLREMSHRLGFTYNIMRNSLYMENFLTDSILLENRFDHIYMGIGKDAAFAPIAKDDSAACAAALLLGKGEPNTAYDLTTNQLVTQEGICKAITERSEVPYKYAAIENLEDAYEILGKMGLSMTTDNQGSDGEVMPWCVNDMVTNSGSLQDGTGANITDHVEKLLGRKPLHLEDIIDNYRYMWEENITEYKDVH